MDISHEVTPFEIAEGAYLIAQAWRYFPKKTVHVVVVDPGVGTARRPILVEAAGPVFRGAGQRRALHGLPAREVQGAADLE